MYKVIMPVDRSRFFKMLDLMSELRSSLFYYRYITSNDLSCRTMVEGKEELEYVGELTFRWSMPRTRIFLFYCNLKVWEQRSIYNRKKFQEKSSTYLKDVTIGMLLLFSLLLSIFLLILGGFSLVCFCFFFESVVYFTAFLVRCTCVLFWPIT